ncbi:hypothetical protein QUA79_09020 [Microcoleus sp. F8-D1]
MASNSPPPQLSAVNSRRPDAESYLKALRHLMPAVPHTIVFVNALSVLDENSVPIPIQLSIES